MLRSAVVVFLPSGTVAAADAADPVLARGAIPLRAAASNHRPVKAVTTVSSGAAV